MRADHRHALARLKPVAPDTDLRARVRDVLAHRALLVSAIAEIDNELQAVFEALAADHPVAVPPAPQSPVVLAPALRAAETRTRRARRAQEIRSESNASPKWPRGASVDADVCRAIACGLDTPRQLWARLDWGQSAIRAALRRLVETGQIVVRGATWRRRFALPPSLPRRTVRDGDRELEVAWTPHRDAPSLIGARDTRNV